MQIIESLNNPDKHPIALTIGNFDGVHIGHQAILQAIVSVAKTKNYVPAAMTFAPHAKVFFKQLNNFLISSNQEKALHIAEQGISTLYQIPFNQAFSQMRAEQFINHLMHDLNVKYLLVGNDFRFGYQGKGDFDLLKHTGNQHNIGVVKTPTIYHHNQRVSSSRVRDRINACDFDAVADLLGRRLTYTGTVIYGNQLGRTINFPTANIQLPDSRILPKGVFAVKVMIENDNKPHYGMCNIGTKPTIDSGHHRQLETHLFDYNADLYNKSLNIEPITKIRDEKKFDNIDALAKQIAQDKQDCLKFLGLS